MQEQINKKILLYILITISFVLISAFVIEYQLNYKPCNLCIYQRIPYFISIPFIAIIFFTKKHTKIILLLLALIFISSTVLAFYHFGIEQGFIDEPSTCNVKNLDATLSKEVLQEQLKQNTISCKNVDFRIFGLSLATINTIFSLLISAIFIKLFFNYGKN